MALDLNNLATISVGLASPEMVLEWSRGEAVLRNLLMAVCSVRRFLDQVKIMNVLVVNTRRSDTMVQSAISAVLK